MLRLYSPPDGYFDQPFLYVYDAAALTDGQNALNQNVQILSGWGDFILRRIVGLDRVLNPTNTAPFGQFQIRDYKGRYYQETPECVGTSGKNGLMGQQAVLPEQVYPELSSILFDLWNVQRTSEQAMSSGKPIYSSQLGFHGVRRIKGKPYPPKYRFREKSFTYVTQATLNSAAFDSNGNPAIPQSVYQKISNYDFDLYEIRIFYDCIPPGQGSQPGGPLPVASVLNPSQANSYFPNNSQYPGNRLGIQVGSNLYYIVLAEIGSNAGGQNTQNIWIQKSTNGGATWNLMYNGPTQMQFMAAVLVGSTIHIIGDNFNDVVDHLHVYHYNTLTDSFTTASDFPANGTLPNRGITASAFKDGKILVCYTSLASGQPTVAIYDPVADTMTAGTNLSPFLGGSSRWITAQVTDVAGTNLAMIFIATTQGSIQTEEVVVCDENLTIQPSVNAYSAASGIAFQYQLYGPATPVIANGQIITLYADPPPYTTGVDPILYAVRSPISTALNFSAPEVVENTLHFPPSLWTFNHDAPFGWGLGVDGSGKLYAFYSQNATRNDDGTSQTSIAYRTSIAAGVWSAKTVLYTGPIPSSSLQLFPLQMSGGRIGLFETFVDPTKFFGPNPDDQYNSLTVLFFAPSPSTCGATVTKAQNKVMLYDQNVVQCYSQPVLDVFVNALSPYKNGAVVPPLFYPLSSQIRLDFYSLMSDLLVPVTVTIHFVGKQRIPCE